MWYFSSPQIVFGEGSMAHLETLEGKRAFIISDFNLNRMGAVQAVCAALPSGMEWKVFDAVEPEPGLQTVRHGAEILSEYAPDWIVAVGGGSVIDAAKAMWILYECPEVDPASINPIEHYGLRRKARLAVVPTTAGTGSEATWAIVLSDEVERRKLGLGSREAVPDVAVLDPQMIVRLPPRLTADTGLDALAHAIEGYTSTFHNDFSDGLCLAAVRLIFQYLPRAYANGVDLEAREHMQNAATLAGLGFGNSMAALAHGLGHALGTVFHVPHGRAVALFLPYTIEYCAAGDPEGLRYADLAHCLHLPSGSEPEAAAALAGAIRALETQVGQPQTLRELGTITRADLERELETLAANALNDTQTIMSPRVPELDEIRALFLAAYG